MNPAINTPEDAAATLRIEGELTIFRTDELWPALCAEPAPTEVDLSAVTDIDTAGVQMLLAATRAARARRQSMRLTGHSDAVLDVLRLLGVHEQLAAEPTP